jgi:hypothetical protein
MNHSEEEKNTSIAIIAIVAALALLGVVAVTIVTIPLQQQAEARGCIGNNVNGIAFNASH